MNLQNAKQKYIEAQRNHAERIEDIENLQRADSDNTIQQARHAEREAWKRLDAARKGLIEAKLESIGR